jgi:hypothetical protein
MSPIRHLLQFAQPTTSPSNPAFSGLGDQFVLADYQYLLNLLKNTLSSGMNRAVVHSL